MDRVHDLIIVGGGPAALSAAFYALAKKLNSVMLYENLGGKLGWRQRFTGPPQLPPLDRGRVRLGDALQDEIVDLEDVSLPGNEVVRLLISRTAMQASHVMHDRALNVEPREGIFAVNTQHHGTIRGAAVLVATGAEPTHLDVPGARRRTLAGLGYSPTTYANLVTGKRVAVIGCTERALRGAAELARTAARIYLITPSTEPISHMLRTLLRRPNVEYLSGFEVKEVIGAATIRGLVVECMGTTRMLEVEHAFVDLGLTPNSGLVKDLVQTDPEGFIVVDERNATTVPGIFAAGDVTAAFGEQVLIAVGDGARAAMSAYTFLLGGRLAGDDSAECPDGRVQAEQIALPVPAQAATLLP